MWCVRNSHDHASKKGNSCCSYSYKDALVEFPVVGLFLSQVGALVDVGSNSPRELKPQSIVAAPHWCTDGGGFAHNDVGFHSLFPALWDSLYSDP